MILFKHSDSIRSYLDTQRALRPDVGFVPTMGALHDGHISLLKRSKKQTQITVCSIYINPTQFNDKKDFEKYPTSIEEDINKIESVGTDILFFPGTDELYPKGITQLEQYDLGYLETILEGRYRPGHFQGVCQVMDRLLKIIKPDKLFLGQKDYQQTLIIEQFLKSIGAEIELLVCPTVREPGGLAMSSRNSRLHEAERKTASSIYESLKFTKENLRQGELSSLKEKAISFLSEKDFIVDYFEIADAATLEPVNSWDGSQKLIALVAVYLKGVRLIDNILLYN
jgi:pantoate--beta-alanine ligase